ncbi:unconventional myosin-Va-like isoform X2 [Hydractinia symbiolongicarpus]|uniref:unconventional myosin-Va-like isoform X2 n=1 Tax=Hydractinia symbiolongicarpus TaxID=13093 RepID=UPI002550D13A|nr:unconventional myosin-Va-like isoform X2 [Hydractinia symbiolongicarpus]
MKSEILYTKDTRIWIPDEQSVWIGGVLLEDLHNDQLEIELEDGREVVVDLKSSKFHLPPLRNPDILVGCNDLTTLSYLHEPAVLHNLKERFINSHDIYTYCGIVLVALNPYENVPLYGSDIVSAYSGKPMGEMDPHIFAVAEDAFRSMITLGLNQSIIVSGESGAGKTVSAKYTMRYFANVGGSLTETMIEQKVLASNPIMEAIGNAKTIRNDNSSRFGKYIEINFNEKYHIIGANMRTYLLEKSRVVYQAQDERNYHIFYQLCASCDMPELQELNLKHSDDFFYTQQGENPTIPSVDDQKCFQDTCEALALLGIYSEQQRMIWRILASILHLGNISIIATNKSQDQCLIKASNGRDALAKHIYSQLFKWIVEHVNSSLAITSQRKSFIGVLDIYGFETFEVNSFEQFCINYANEKLQQQFNQHVFKLEQDEYVKEQIVWSFIDFYDNQPCIDLIELKLGILDLLDEECRMPKGADESWARKLYAQHLKKAQHFVKPRMSDVAFIIRHYADDVIYDCNGFVEKNRDLINEEHLALLRASEYELVGELFSSNDTSSAHVPRKRTTSRVGSHAPRTKKTVGSEFRDSLKKLMEVLNSTSPHYVRCIKSNDDKAAFQLDLHRCVQQLRACGVLETIRISAAGYPSRWTYKEFFDRYRMLIPWKSIDWDSLHGTCHNILSSHIQDEDKFQLGKTKIFFRAGAVAYLERLRSDMLKRSCIKIQKNVKSWIMCRKYRKLRKATILIQAWIKGHQARRLAKFLRETYACITIQKVWRGHKLHKKYQSIRRNIILIQSAIRGVLVRRKMRAILEVNKSVVIQRVWRGYKVRKSFLKAKKSIVFLQCCVRRKAAKRELKRLKIEAKSVEHLKSLTKGMEKKVMTLQEKLTEERKEKELVQAKVIKLKYIEDEVRELRELKPQWENLVQNAEKLKQEKDDLENNVAIVTEENKKLVNESESLKNQKDEEIAALKKAMEELQQSLLDQKKENEEEKAESEAILKRELEKQREELVAEFNTERASHQKMLGEYTRLEQRFTNLQEELKIEKNSPEKRRRSTVNSGDELSEIVTEEIPLSEDQVTNLSLELFEVTRERDMLLEQVELLKEEHEISVSISKVASDEGDKSKNLQQENKMLRSENDKIKKELGVLAQAIEEDEEENLAKQDRIVTQLLKQIEELRAENKELAKKANRKEASDQPIILGSNIPDMAEKEISRLTMENIELREELEKSKSHLKEALERSITSPPRNNLVGRRPEQGGVHPRSKSNVSELGRSRSIENRISDGNLTEAGKLFMTYAGLMRKKPVQFGKQGTPEMAVNRKGMLQFTSTDQAEVVAKLILDIQPTAVEKEVPGLPAHIVFMGLRYVDHINDERLMQSYLTGVISSVKKRVTKIPGDIDMQAFWLANTFRLYCDMKQFSGEQQFQSMNTREQNEYCLSNFDLSEYRQVLSDTCIKIYQDMASNIQSRVNNLIVPGMLEYESIPGVVSTLRRFKSEKKKSEEIITVKDITNKLSAILAVLNAHCVDPSLIKQIFRQIYYYINATMVNNILLRKDMCHWSRGLQIKFNLTQLEEWCRTNQLHENFGVVDQLEPITEVVQLLQVNKRSLDDVDGIIAITSKLNSLQVQKILSMYTPPNEYEPRVPGNLIRAVVNKMQKTEGASLMLDLKYVVPMTVPFVASTVNFDKINIPSLLGMDHFEVI